MVSVYMISACKSVRLTDRGSAAATRLVGHYLTLLKHEAPASCMRLLDVRPSPSLLPVRGAHRPCGGQAESLRRRRNPVCLAESSYPSARSLARCAYSDEEFGRLRGTKSSRTAASVLGMRVRTPSYSGTLSRVIMILNPSGSWTVKL